MIKGVIFDVDGVLLNSMPVWENLGELYLDHLGIEAEKNLGETLFEMSLEEAADYLISHYNLEKTVEEVVQGLNKEVEDYYAKRVPLKEGVRQYLEEFRERKIPMVIATTGDRKNAEAALSRLKVLPYFQGVFTASEIGSGKDQPDIYFAALLQLDTEPEQSWVFEDTYQALRTAKHAGFKTVAVYDKANDKNLAQIWNTADIYLPEFDEFNVFWNWRHFAWGRCLIRKASQMIAVSLWTRQKVGCRFSDQVSSLFVFDHISKITESGLLKRQSFIFTILDLRRICLALNLLNS